MRAFKKFSKRGFTLVELMIVVAIIGVLAALAIFGVRRYLASAKTSEAKNTIGAIVRGAEGAFEREITASQLLTEGGSGGLTAHTLCGTSNKVPSSGVPVGTKYQPSTVSGNDFENGDAVNGWKCIRFDMVNAIYYQYSYNSPATALAAGPTLTTGGGSFEADAQGDLDGNSILSTFSRGGQVNASTQQLVVSTQIYVNNEYE